MPSLLIKGIEEFNRGQFFECHDTLEELWRLEKGPVRSFYQGILQIGVAFYQLLRGNYRGAVKLLDSGLELLEPFGPRFMGVEVGELLDEAGRCRDLLLQLGPERINAFDRVLLPQIAYAE
ncbi:MAG: DUF309 domain-containing protein [Chloroflexi bacterium]|nr:DUF309 domain-containing protein [Chloroflexota bacterium]